MRVFVLASVVLSIAASGFAVPMGTIEFGTVPERSHSLGRDPCHLEYYNICSGYVLLWHIYCGTWFHDAPLPLMYGTCFSLADCAGDCRNLDDVWWSCKRFTARGYTNVEVYCANDNCCPVGPPIAGIYGYVPDWAEPWQHLDFGGLPLCGCEEAGASKFIIMITDFTASIVTTPYSDINWLNVEEGCETQWRCSGHSFVYQNVMSYCSAYGAPGAAWLSGPNYGCTNHPPVPPGCHYYPYDTGCYLEWLIDCYVSCEGPTKTQEDSWSEVKALYK